MPTLLEMQSAMRQMLAGDKAAAAAMLSAGITSDRLDIYRNTFLVTLTRALKLSFPAVAKLVGDAFFEGAAQIFITEHPPRAAWLDQYGGDFADFLQSFAPAQSVAYLADVARLEWAVSTALHAPDTEPLDPAALASLGGEDQGRICLIADPSIGLLQLAYPADAIWRAVLAGSDAALGKIDLKSGPVDLLIERRADGVAVERFAREPWQFLAKLCAGEPIEAAIDPAHDFDVPAALAEHLAAGRFTGFRVAAAADEGLIS
jgi:hypothetical protein